MNARTMHRAANEITRDSGSSLQTLEQRLEDGYCRIEQGLAEGLDVSQWEDFWIDLLRQYEVLADGVDESASWDLAA